MGSLDRKIALVTGAAGGIGRASALAFSREGAAVVCADIDEVGAEETANAVRELGGTAEPIAADVSNRKDVEAMVQHALTGHGGLDCAFNCAGIVGPMHPLLGYDDDEFERILAVNVRGTWNCLKQEIQAMLDTGGGAVVNASSGLGVVAVPEMPAYVASKHAVLGLTRAAALEYARQGVRVNAVLPGVIDTAMPRSLAPEDPDHMELLRSGHPVGRIGQPEEVAEAVVWLCGPDSSFVTGHGMAIDGGYLSQ